MTEAMTAAPMSDDDLFAIERFYSEYPGWKNLHPGETHLMMRRLVDELRRLRAQPQPSAAGVVVPVELVLWLLGEGDAFECPPEQYFRGKPAPYFWRRRLRDAVKDQIAAATPEAAS